MSISKKHTIKTFNGVDWDVLYPKTTAEQVIGIDKVNNTADSQKSVASATKLTTPVQINGVLFDGSNGVQLPLLNVVVGHSIAATTKPWHKIASVEIKTNYQDCNIVFHVQGTFSSYSNRNGILHVSVRADTIIASRPKVTCTWEYMNNMPLEDFVVAFNEKTSPTIVEIWVKSTIQYNRYLFNVISECSTASNSAPGSIWTLYNNPAGVESITEGFIQLASTYQPNFIEVSNGIVTTPITSSADVILKRGGGAWHGALLTWCEGNSYGGTLLVQSGGAVIIGGGEGATNLQNVLQLKDNEEIHLASDGKIFMHTACQTIANRKTITIEAGNITGINELTANKLNAPAATVSTNGLMDSADKLKLDKIPTIEVSASTPASQKVGDFWLAI